MKVMGLDIGTTNLSAVVMDEKNGVILKSVTIPSGSALDLTRQNPQIIVDKICGMADSLLAEYPDIASIGLTCQMHGILYLNNQGQPVSPLYTWQDESGNLPCFGQRSVCRYLQEEYGVKTHSGYGLVTYIYHAQRKKIPKDAASLCTIGDYLAMVLTGRKKPVTHSSNAASLGLFDGTSNSFFHTILLQLGASPERLPRVTDEICTLGLYRGIPVSVAIGDNQASYLGAVRDAENTLLVNIGTGSQISVLSRNPSVEEGIEARPLAPELYLLVGASLCGGRAYSALAEFFRSIAGAVGQENVDPYKMMEKWLEENSFNNPMKVTTTFCGTREQPEKRGVIENISISNLTPGDLTYGVLVGMAEELWEKYQKILQKTGGKHSRIIASGNAIRRNIYLQRIIAVQFAMPLEISSCQEEAACGAALAGTVGAGFKKLEDILS